MTDLPQALYVLGNTSVLFLLLLKVTGVLPYARWSGWFRDAILTGVGVWTLGAILMVLAR